MIRRITLENYMSHARTVIEPADGLTVLVGPNNCGKSAVVSALQTICGQHAGDFMVRHGQKVCRITVETHEPAADGSGPGESHTVVWQRKGGAVSYVIDGRDVARAGRGNLPDGLHDLLKLPPVEAKSRDEQFHVHFGCQKTPIFLLDSESDTAAFFSSSAEAERLLEMQRRHKQKAQQAKTEHRTTEADVRRLDERLAALSPLEALAPEVEAVEAEHRSLVDDAAAADLLERRIAGIERCEARAAELRATLVAYDDLKPPPATENPTPLAQLIQKVERGAAESAKFRSEAEALSPLSPPPVLTDDASVGIVCHRLEALRRQVSVESAKVAALAPLADPPTPTDVRPLQQIGSRLKTATATVAAARATATALASLAEPPAMADPAPLAAEVAKVERTAADADRRRAAAARAEREIGAVEREIVAYVLTNPLCPTCGGPLTADHVMHGGAADVVA